MRDAVSGLPSENAEVGGFRAARCCESSPKIFRISQYTKRPIVEFSL